MRGKADHLAQQSGKRRRPGGRAAEVRGGTRRHHRVLLEEHGYERMEIPAVAERAGVNKTSIYRRWPGKAELVLDVALARLSADVPLPDTGTLQGDFTALLRTIAAAISTPFLGGLLRAFISQEHEAGIAQARGRFWDERYRISGEVLRRAVARGELPAKTDQRLMMQMAVAPLFYGALVTGTAMTRAEITAIAERVIAAFRV